MSKSSPYTDGTYDVVVRISTGLFCFIWFEDGRKNDVERPVFVPADITDDNAWDRSKEVEEAFRANGYETGDRDWGMYDGELLVIGFRKRKDV